MCPTTRNIIFMSNDVMGNFTHIKQMDCVFDFKINSLSYELMLGLGFEHNIQEERKTLTLGTYSIGKLMGTIAQVVGYFDLIPKEISVLNLL